MYNNILSFSNMNFRAVFLNSKNPINIILLTLYYSRNENQSLIFPCLQVFRKSGNPLLLIFTFK